MILSFFPDCFNTKITLYTSGYGETIPTHAIPNITPLNRPACGGADKNKVRGRIPSRNGSKHINIKRLLFNG